MMKNLNGKHCVRRYCSADERWEAKNNDEGGGAEGLGETKERRPHTRLKIEIYSQFYEIFLVHSLPMILFIPRSLTMCL